MKDGGVRPLDVLGAIWLHDVIEDMAARPDEIRPLFGARFMPIVEEGFDHKGISKIARKYPQVRGDHQGLIRIVSILDEVQSGFFP